jgi:hypothetical protein
VIARRWTLIWLVVLTSMVGLGVPVAAQYNDGLPQGVTQITVDGQPIDASTTPQINNRNPVFAGRLKTGPTTVELGLGDGTITRFTLDVDPSNGRFRGGAPDKLDAQTYSLYINDELVGQFVITGAAATPEPTGGLLDLARLVPFPFDLADALPGLAVVTQDARYDRYYTLADQAQITVQGGGDNASRDAIAQAQQQLQAAGFRQRYSAQIASPTQDDPQRFDVQINSDIIEYASADNADAGYTSLTTQATSQDAQPVDKAAKLGDASQFFRRNGLTGQTGVAYRSLILIIRQDRILMRVEVADLRNREPDQAAFETLGKAMQDRATAAIVGKGVGLSPQALRLDLSGASGSPVIREGYEVVDGEVIPFYNEDQKTRDARQANYVGTTDVYSASISAIVVDTGAQGAAPAGGTPDAASKNRNRNRADGTPRASSDGGREATPQATAGQSTSSIDYAVSLYAFPGETEATDWLTGLPDRLDKDPLAGYLSFAPVQDAPSVGDASAAYTFRRRSGDVTVSGFRYYVRVGAQVAAVELAGAPEATMADIQAVLKGEVACLKAGSCPETAENAGGRSTSNNNGKQDKTDKGA